MAYTKYTDKQKEKALLLLASLGSVAATSRQLKIPKKTIAYWRDNPQSSDEKLGLNFASIRAENKNNVIKQMHEAFGGMVSHLVANFTNKDTSLKDKATTFGILADKAINLEASLSPDLNINMTHSGPDGGPIESTINLGEKTAKELAQLYREMVRKSGD